MIIIAGKPMGRSVFNAFVAVILVKLPEEFHCPFRVIEVSGIETMKVEVGDERAVEMQVGHIAFL